MTAALLGQIWGPTRMSSRDDMRFEYTEPGLEYSFQVPYGAETVTVAVTPNAEDYNAATNPDGADWAIVSHDDADEEETGASGGFGKAKTTW